MATGRVLYLLGSAAPAVLGIRGAVELAQAAGWDVCVGLTGSAAEWLGTGVRELESLTWRPVRHRHRRPEEVDPWPEAAVALVAPVTFNAVNSWALGLTSEWPVAFAAEAIGKGIRLVAVPSVNEALAAHPQWARSLEVLRGAGVRVLERVGAGEEFPWARALSECEMVDSG
ncbi:flavoprotein [Kitasatospora sp. NPDC006697]|uniref:flavoprotein n=1 Tax=Kitasatospora sp. NPDC006697 TaxID=3364020 RepID=UPI00369F69D1